MSSETDSIAGAGLASSGGKKRLNWKLPLWLLALGVLSGLGAYLWQNGSSQNGEPVLVLDLPKLDDSAAQNAVKGGKLPIRSTIDSSSAPKTEKTAEPKIPAQTDIASSPGQMSLPAGNREIRRAPEPPPGMHKVRIIDPSRSPATLARSLRQPLVRAPVKALQEKTPFGAIPRIARDGRKPFDVYARPYKPKVAAGKPQAARIAIMIGGLGISPSSTREAINKLPGVVTLGFAPYGQGLQNLVDAARRGGHEVMLQIPMEPFDYPDNDPGPRTLLSTIEPSENVKRLQWLMSRFSGYFGVTNYMGARFTASKPALQPIMKWIGMRGLVFLDDGASPRSQTMTLSVASGLPVKAANIRLDYGQTPQSIKTALEDLEALAAEQGFAIGVGTGLPLTIKFVAAWARTLADRGIELIPVSAAFRK
ncbi:MAG TPA: divergent polysaccharide deacetylase family protein [Rhizobiales bacterium]|nr:divergent polysaccharide deacetylase family protein [Hyphomicrobiales bacterium]